MAVGEQVGVVEQRWFQIIHVTEYQILTVHTVAKNSDQDNTQLTAILQKIHA